MNELHGLWYDGNSSRARAVTLSQPAAGALRVTDDDASSDWPIAELRLSPRLGQMERHLHLPDGGHVECTDSPLFDRWFPAQGRVERVADWLERRRAAALAAAAITVLGIVLFFTVGLPWAADRVAPHVPPRVEQAMSQQVLALLERSGQLQPSRLPTARQRQLQAEFRGLVAALPRERDMRLEFHRAPAIGPNAFALPDGLIVMTDELVALAKSDDEIIAVLAHEAGHHAHRHALRQTLESSGIVVMASLMFGDASGSSLTVSLPVVLLETGYSRRHEREADDFALATLAAQHRSPQAFADILKRLSAQQHLDDSGPIGYLSTHPPSQERIDRAERAARSAKQ